MINIISKAVLSRHSSGPKKVVDNLIKGLREMGYPFVINKSLDSCKRLWIHDDREALKYLKDLPNDIKSVIGPNLYILPRNIPADLDLSRSLYIQPSAWAKELWVEGNYDRSPLDFWPTGIDTEEYKPTDKEKSFVLVYFKQRSEEELGIIEDILKKGNINYKILKYGRYNEEEYKELLHKSRYLIWLGRQESQGIALEEALSADVPILVWDVKNLGHWQASRKEMAVFNEKENAFAGATSIPYFDNRCGLIIKDRSGLESAIAEMERSYGQFKPREYILENLNLKKQAGDFIGLYEKYFGLDIKDGFQELLLNSKTWRNSKWYYKIYYRLKDNLKT